MKREFVNFGKSGVKVTRMAMGTAFRSQNDADEAKRTISTALDGGLNLIDCANAYGFGNDRSRTGTSEIIVGELMKDRGDRDDVVITSKVSSRIGPGINDQHTSRWHIMREVERSLERLQTDRIDVLLIHHFDESVGYEERTRALEDLVRDGKIRYTGLCNYQAWQVVQTLRVQDRINADSLITIQNPYNLLNREPEDEMFPMVRATGLGIMAYSPLGVGLLSGDYSPDRMPDRTRIWGSRRAHAFDPIMRGRAADVIRTNAEVAEKIGATPAQVAQAWVLTHPEITVSISGADTAEQMEDNLGALEIEIPEEELAKLNEASYRLRITLDGPEFGDDG